MQAKNIANEIAQRDTSITSMAARRRVDRKFNTM